MSLHLHLASAARLAAAVAHLAVPAGMASAQGFHFERPRAAYEINKIYDRLTDSTRVTVALRSSSRRFGIGSRIWFDVSYVYAGRQLTSPPENVVATLQSFTPSRGGWAFARPQPLRVSSGKNLKLEVPAAEYQRLRVRLFDAGRRELLAFRIPTERFIAMLAEPELELRAGSARMRLRERQMAALRETLARLAPASAGAR